MIEGGVRKGIGHHAALREAFFSGSEDQEIIVPTRQRRDEVT